MKMAILYCGEFVKNLHCPLSRLQRVGWNEHAFVTNSSPKNQWQHRVNDIKVCYNEHPLTKCNFLSKVLNYSTFCKIDPT